MPGHLKQKKEEGGADGHDMNTIIVKNTGPPDKVDASRIRKK